MRRFKGLKGLSNFSNSPSKCSRTSLHNHYQNIVKPRLWQSLYWDKIIAVSQNVLMITKVKPWKKTLDVSVASQQTNKMF